MSVNAHTLKGTVLYFPDGIRQIYLGWQYNTKIFDIPMEVI